MPTFIEHHDTGRTYRFTIHLDEEMTTEDGAPHPDWTMTLEWSKQLPIRYKRDERGAVIEDADGHPIPVLDDGGRPVPAMTEAEYIAQITEEARLLALHELARRRPDAPTPFAIAAPTF